MKILYLSLEFPIPVNNGHRLRLWSILESLAALGHKITLVSLAEEGEVRENLDPLKQICHRVELVPHHLRRLGSSSDYGGRLRALLSCDAYSLRRFRSPRMRSRVEQCIREEDPNVIISDTVFSVGNLPETRVPLYINNPDVEHVIVQRYANSSKNPLIRFYANMEAKLVRAWEQYVCRSARVCMACSEQDRLALSSLAPTARVLVVPNVVKAESYEPSFASTSRSILFQGGMDWLPNRDGVEYFIMQIFPLIRKDIPDVEFVGAGRNPPPELLGRFSAVPGVKFTGTVPDMRPFLHKADICVVPLRIGSGTRLKILESAAAGKAIVSTRLGAEGLNFLEGEEILLADEPEAFAAAVTSLLRDPMKRRAMGEAACRRVRADYSYARLKTCLQEALSSVS